MLPKLNVDVKAQNGDDSFEPPEAEAGLKFERIPLPWFIKRRAMTALLRDVHQTQASHGAD